MSRIAWSLPIAAVLALTLVSCFSDVGDCPTCPHENSATLKISVSPNGLVDSVFARVDGGAQVTVHRKGQAVFNALSAGTHVVETTRWFNNFGIPVPRAETFTIEMARGETRTIAFHNDFPLITWREPGSRDRAAEARHAVRPGWASA